MRISGSAILYIAAGLGAIAVAAFFGLRSPDAPTPAQSTDYSAFQELLEGDMKKLRFHAAPKPVSALPFLLDAGGEGTLGELTGKYVLLNFWATWCAPCRHEMPMLSELQGEFGSDAFEVVTVATGRNPPPAMAAFFDEIGVTNLPLHRDPKQKLARDMAVLGLPVTILIDPQGQEIARMQGDATWNGNSAKAMLTALLNNGPDK